MTFDLPEPFGPDQHVEGPQLEWLRSGSEREENVESQVRIIMFDLLSARESAAGSPRVCGS